MVIDIKVKVENVVYEIAVQESQDKVILHCGESHAAGIEFFECLERLMGRVNGNK